VAAAVVGVQLVTFLTYRAAGSSAMRHRVVLARCGQPSCCSFFCLPAVLVVKAAVPQQNFLGVLIDDSRSMQIADWNQAPRANFARQTFATPDAALLKSLSDRFVIRTFRFSSTASRVGAPSDLTFAGAQTRIGASLDGARQELAGLPLAGLVVVSDGADTTDASLTDALLAMKAASVPVFTVGVGRESLAKDVQVDRVSAPRAALKGTSLMIDVVVTDRVRGRVGDARRGGRRKDRGVAGSEAADRR
jgi:hypothetical protein